MIRSRVGIRILGTVSAAWGVALLAKGRRWWTLATGQPPTTIERAAMLVLACRQLGQGLTQLAAPDRLRRTWVVVDLAHAASMAPLARARRLRRPALLSAGWAATSAAISLRLSRAVR